MARIVRVLRKKRLTLILGAMLLAAALYLWQMVVILQKDQDDANLPGRPIANLHGYAARLDPLTGTGTSGETLAVLRANRRADTGQLLVRNLPILPPAEVYKMWSVDAIGTIDAAAEFNAPFYGSGTFPVDVITAQLLGVYTRFFITVEPFGGHNPLPTGRVVLIS
jgi:hypothetical protein